MIELFGNVFKVYFNASLRMKEENVKQNNFYAYNCHIELNNKYNMSVDEIENTFTIFTIFYCNAMYNVSSACGGFI